MLVSLANNVASDTEFILGVRSFIFIMNNSRPRTDPWGFPSFIVPQSQNIWAVLGDFTAILYLKLVK